MEPELQRVANPNEEENSRRIYFELAEIMSGAAPRGAMMRAFGFRVVATPEAVQRLLEAGHPKAPMVAANVFVVPQEEAWRIEAVSRAARRPPESAPKLRTAQILARLRSLLRK